MEKPCRQEPLITSARTSQCPLTSNTWVRWGDASRLADIMGHFLASDWSNDHGAWRRQRPDHSAKCSSHQAIVIPILFSSTSSSSQVSSSLSTKGRTRVDKGAKEEEKEKEQRGGDTASVISVCREVKSRLENCGVKVKVDERENYTPGWKFNEWELKGVPLRIEVGPRDVAAGSVVL